jgi:hypothetical protein
MYLSYTIWYHLLNLFHLVLALVHYQGCYNTWMSKYWYVYVPSGNSGASRERVFPEADRSNLWWGRERKCQPAVNIKSGTARGLVAFCISTCRWKLLPLLWSPRQFTSFLHVTFLYSLISIILCIYWLLVIGWIMVYMYFATDLHMESEGSCG